MQASLPPNLLSPFPFSERPKIKPAITSSPRTKALPKHRLFKESIQNLTIDDHLLKRSPAKIHSLASKLAKSKSFLHLEFSSFLANLSQAHNAAIILKKLSSIKSLKLRLCLSSTQKLQKALNLLTNSFRKSHYLTALEVEFGFYNHPNPRNIKKLSYLLQTMQKLTSLTMTRFTQTPSSGNTLQFLLKGIQKLPSLSCLNLNFYKGYLGDEQIDILCSGLSSCKSLVTLDLSLQACFHLTNQGINKLMLMTTKDLEVKFLRLSLYVLFPVNESTFYRDLDSILKPTKKKEFPLGLKVSSTYREVLQLTILQFSLKNLRTGKPMNFYIRFHQIDDSRVRFKEKVTRELQLNLPCLKYIKSFDLCVFYYYGKESFSYDLAACIKSMESLESLTFNFNAKNSLKEYSWLASSFEELKTRAQLATLKLEFHNFTFNDKQIQHFASCLSKISKFRVLELDLLENKVPHTIFETFAKINLKNLTRLYFALALSADTKIETLKGLERFCASLENLKKLKGLDIRLKDS